MSQQNAVTFQDKPFDFTDKDFAFISKLVFKKTAIVLGPHKKNMVYSRIAKRIRKLGLSSFSEYCDMLSSDEGDSEIMDFINAVTTNLTHFFRENHHFEHLAKVALPEVVKNNSVTKRLRIWSAGCSSGMEPYSIAMTVKSTLGTMAGWDIKILATDIDTTMLERGAKGVYTDEEIKSIPQKMFEEFVKHDEKNEEIIMSERLKELISFKRMNFVEEWPVRGPFDIIFCRNVVIYFNKDTQRVLFNKFADVMGEKSYLYIGHSENLHGVTDRFQLMGKTIYRKIK